MELTTPSLLFPAISLLMLAYTNRFLVLANLARELYAKYQDEPDENIAAQIANLQIRNRLTKNMQIFGALSFLFCVICMFLLFAGVTTLANWSFGLALLLLLASLALLVWELHLSIDALDAHLSGFSYTPKEDHKTT
ncbi:MAG: DUF2721 domain-containing protein [Firmicutes bacterium]|nr:DUF2721 domain-containing protein [Bacillota bacterium]